MRLARRRLPLRTPDSHLHVEPGLPFPYEDAAGGSNVLIVAANRDPHVPLSGQAVVGGIDPDPAKLRQAAFHPRVCGRVRETITVTAVCVQVA